MAADEADGWRRDGQRRTEPVLGNGRSPCSAAYRASARRRTEPRAGADAVLAGAGADGPRVLLRAPPSVDLDVWKAGGEAAAASVLLHELPMRFWQVSGDSGEIPASSGGEAAAHHRFLFVV